MRRIAFYLLMVVMVVAGLSSRSWAQAPVSQALQAMRRVAATYQQARFLSFDVLYRYAAEDKRNEYLDSLKGQYKVHGSRYWSVLDNRESVYDTRLLLLLFQEDSLIYLARPASATGQEAALNPLAMPDTFLLNQKNMDCSYTVSPQEELIGMHFTGNGPCREVTWHVDRKSGYLTKMVSIMRADQLYDPSVRSLVTDAASAYVIVETLYTNYRQGTFDESVFDLGRYIKKEGKGYVTVAPYERYKVFVGTPGL